AGRKGVVSEAFKSLIALDPSERRDAGRFLNQFKADIQKALNLRKKDLGNKMIRSAEDITLPGFMPSVGHLHPLTKVSREIKSIFKAMGFTEVQGPEVETEYYNFEALNIPEGHPAREMHDTLFVDDQVVLRTHTSPVQVRVMEKQSPPIRVISPGRCYRRDTPDATHSPVFHQVEGLCVDEGVTFGDLKGVLLNFARNLFGSNVSIRFRPSFFPFTEPSAEYDFSCVMCEGKGCRICKNTGWIEISGAGMVNPAVFNYVNIDEHKYTGYAFGMGIERIAMLLYGVLDIRLFYENDIRFINQF
ncbi:MAG TPA: phenylalanine--tRNA ligase subunit alpha, partial [bacterium]|nr:phenylalanine--tRNA ligase subunit alpha [bacterium]